MPNKLDIRILIQSKHGYQGFSQISKRVLQSPFQTFHNLELQEALEPLLGNPDGNLNEEKLLNEEKQQNLNHFMIPPQPPRDKVQFNHRVVDRQYATIDYRVEDQNYIVDNHTLHSSAQAEITFFPLGYSVVFTALACFGKMCTVDVELFKEMKL